MSDRIREKLQILADAAKYDVSCSSSGSDRKNKNKGLGMPVIRVFAIAIPKMAAVYLLKILFSNVCILTAPIAFHAVLMTSNVRHLRCKRLST